MTPAPTLLRSARRRAPRGASGWRWAGALLGLACALAPAAAGQPPQMSGAYAVGGGEAFQAFALGTADAAAFAASVQAGGGVACPAYRGEQPFETDDALRRAARLLHSAVPDAAGCGAPEPLYVQADSAYIGFQAAVEHLGASDPVLSRGALAVVYAAGDVVAFERQLGDARRVIAFNRADAERFLPLPDAGGEGAGAVPGPLTPIFASSGARREIPALVAVVDEDRGEVVYGLRIPARTAVVFRPVEPRDVRPRGLDE